MHKINDTLSHPASISFLKKITPLLMLLIFVFLCFYNQTSQSVTVDEFHHFPSGIYNLMTLDWRMNNESPPLIKCFPALSVLISNPQIDLKSFEKSPNTWNMGYSFMSLNKERYRSIFQYGRCMTIILGCLLGWLLYIWAKDLYGCKGALFALFLYVFNPNIIAHSSLITIDIGASCMIFLSIYCFWKYLINRNLNSIMIAGLALGLAQLAKFTALLLYPIFLIIIIGLTLLNTSANHGDDLQTEKNKTVQYCSDFCIMLLISLIIINAGYFFVNSFEPLSEYHFTSNLLKRLSSLLWDGFRVPLPYDYVKGFDTQLTISAGGIPFYVSYLMGEHSLTGWWYYYIIAFLVKNPEPFLVILFLAAMAWIIARNAAMDKKTALCIWVPTISYFLYFSFFTHIPIGIRYILPVFPLLFLACGYLFNEFILQRKIIKALLVFLILFYLFTVASAFPRYLSYFNIASGGSHNGSHWLIDSNLDWGQSLPGLKEYMDKNNIEKIKLGYFGRVDPEIYGINYALAEKEPTEGIYAVSVNFLVGRPYYLLQENRKKLIYIDMNHFDAYRHLKPSAIIDDSIYIFDMRKYHPVAN